MDEITWRLKPRKAKAKKRRAIENIIPLQVGDRLAAMGVNGEEKFGRLLSIGKKLIVLIEGSRVVEKWARSNTAYAPEVEEIQAACGKIDKSLPINNRGKAYHRTDVGNIREVSWSLRTCHHITEDMKEDRDIYEDGNGMDEWIESQKGVTE